MSLQLFQLSSLRHLPWLALTLAASVTAAAPSQLSALPSPYFREAEFHRHQAQPLLAIASLLAAQKQDLLDQDSHAVDLLLGQLYREYNLPGQAADRFQHASGTRVGSLRGKAWWELAVQRYQRGDYERAHAALARTTGLLPYDLEQQRPLLQAQILIGLNRNAEAAALLNAWQPIQQQGPYERYNVGVALIRDGKLLEGAGMLDSVGTMAAPDTELQALRDQANLAMGYGFLRADHGATARPLFKRVQLDGPFSNLALLGAGWAELAPDGARQQNLYLSPIGCVEDPTRVMPENMMVLRRPSREACDRERTFKSRVFFEQATGAASEAERYRRALIPWQTLIRRSPADAAVQEALLAVPYAYSRLKGREQAIEHYRNAIQLYETERKHLLRSLDFIRETAPVTSTTSFDDKLPLTWVMPRAEDMYYLDSLIASNPFQSTARDLQVLRVLHRTLQPLETRLASLETRLDGSARTLTKVASITDYPETTSVTATASAQTDTDSNRRITYFGVFDFIPPAKTVDSPPAPDTDTLTEDSTETDNLPGIEPEPVVPQRRARRRSGDGTPVARHAQLNSRLLALQKQIKSAESAHERTLRQMALAELTRQQERLDTYLTQARFSLARLLDPALADHTGP